MEKFDPIESLASIRHEFGEHGGVNLSVAMSSTFTVMSADTLPDLFEGRKGPERGYYLYGRHFNPTVYVLGRQLAALEGTEAGHGTASGMSAIASTLMQLCEPGDHIIAGNTLYGGTFALLKEYLPAKCGLKVSLVDVTDLKAVESAFTSQTRVLFVESCSNPTLTVADIPSLAKMAHKKGAKLIVDNTFTPLVISPAQLGADIVVHSLTKFINGASDSIAGAICADKELIHNMVDLHTGSLMLLGPTMDPVVAFRISMRLPHLGLRIVEHSKRALTFAERLEGYGFPVIYPGLKSHPQHTLMKEIANPDYGFGGILAVDLGDTDRANRFMETLQLECKFGFLAVSLGYFETLMSCSSSSTSSELSEEDQLKAGISPGLIRMSIGYTGSLEQRWEQLETALKKLGLI